MPDKGFDAELEKDFLRKRDKQSVQMMLLTSLRNGFQLRGLTRLASHYQTSAAVMDYHNNEATVTYANGKGYYIKRFGKRYQEAVEFTGQFDIGWYE